MLHVLPPEDRFKQDRKESLEAFLTTLEQLMTDGFDLAKCYTTDNCFLLMFQKPDSEESKAEPVVESVIQIPIDENPDTVKQWTDQGWTVTNYYSKQVQLVKHRQPDAEEETKDE